MTWASRVMVLKNCDKIPAATVGVIILVVVISLFTVEQTSIAAVNGWWLDELSTLWISDPSLTFANAYHRIALDPTPTLYYSALYWIRNLIYVPMGRERIVVLLLNFISIFLAFSVVIAVSYRSGVIKSGLAGVAAFLLSGPVLAYTPEARAYLMAMCVVFVASWFTALAVEESRGRPHWACFVFVGVLAALTHLYAAIMCGGLAAGLVIVASFTNRRELVVSGLALGLASVCTYGIWLFNSPGMMVYQNIGWVKFTFANVIAAEWEVRQLEIGGNDAVILLIVLLSYALVRRSTRALTVVFSVAFFVFFGLPVLASFKTPIIAARYWMVGGPAHVVLLVFLARANLIESKNSLWHIRPLVFALGVMVLFVSSSATGFLNARMRTETKLIWKGAEIVTPLIQRCHSGSIHVMGSVIEYAQITHMPAEMFVDAHAYTTSRITPANASCPVLGWSEHYIYRSGDDIMAHLTDEELLNLLKIDATPAEVDIRRHDSGYVVLRRNP